MYLKKIIFIVCLFFFSTNQILFSQEGKKSDDLSLSKDSIIKDEDFNYKYPSEYNVLKKESDKHFFTTALYVLLFKSPKDKDEKKDITNVASFVPYSGKIIRNINVQVMPPYGLDYLDKNYETHIKNYNRLHIITKSSTIKQILQLKEDQKFMPALAMASESELRNTSYIMDAKISIDENYINNDSIDINVYVRDKWSAGVNIFGLTPKNINIELFDDDILGTGNHVGVNFIYAGRYKQKFGYGINYSRKNIYKGVGASLSHIDYGNSYKSEASIYSPIQPRYPFLGEASISKENVRQHPVRWDTLRADKTLDINLALGRAFTIKDDKSLTQFVLTGAFNKTKAKYTDPALKPFLENRPKPYMYTDHETYLLQASLYKNAYKQMYMVYNIGTIQDIQVGFNVTLQAGVSKSPVYNRASYYSGEVSYSTMDIIPGNLFISTKWGSFVKDKKAFSGVFSVDINYFTPLLNINNLFFRQFVDISYSKLVNQYKYLGDYIYLGQKISMLTKDWYNEAKGDELLLVKTETDFYSRLYLGGFHLTFYNFLDFGWMTPGQDKFTNKHFAYGIGFGTRLRNNYIIFNTIDMRIGYYPQMKQTGFGEFFKISLSLPTISRSIIPNLPRVINPN